MSKEISSTALTNPTVFLNKPFYQENVLLEQAFVKDPDKTVQDIITDTIAKLGENIVVSRFVRFQLGEQANNPSPVDN